MVTRLTRLGHRIACLICFPMALSRAIVVNTAAP